MTGAEGGIRGMSIESAKQYRTLALAYRAWGFNLVPLGGDKRPVVTGVSPNGGLMRFRWDDWQQTRQAEEHWAQIKKHAWWTDVGGLGGVCGPVSGDLVCIDFDATPQKDVADFLAGAGLPADYAWTVTTPGGGAHVWLRCPGLEIEKGKEDRPARVAGHIELRWTGHYAALPGSVHPSGGVYRWCGPEPAEGPALVDRDALLLAYAAVTVQEPVKVQPVVIAQPPTNGNGHNGNGAGKWARAAFDGELAALRGAAVNRNDALNKAAFSLGAIVAGGYLTETEVETALEDAGRDIGLNESEILATIRSGMQGGAKSPRHPQALPDSAPAGYEFGFVAPAMLPDALDLEGVEAEALPQHHTWPYAVKDGRMVLLREDKDGEIEATPLADFTATIAEEIADENGNAHLVLQGQGLRRGRFRLEISSTDFGSDSKLLALITAATGGIDIVYKDMHKHLRAAIGKLTTEGSRPQRIRYYRTGWEDESYSTFLMPGMDDTTLISVPRQIAYAAPSPDVDLTEGLVALDNLIGAMDAKLTAPIMAALFMPPMLRPAGLGNERVAVFIAGRTGSLKTSWAQTAMCLYGPEFISNDNLLKLGEGATRNAIMAFAAHAHDLPLLIDNYKPNTGNGKHDFVNLIHNILEGGDRKRSERTGALRDSKPVRCIPIVTGEDLPRDDAASIARILLTTFEWQRGEPNYRLTAAQESSAHLCTVGWTWIQWLQSSEGRAVVNAAGKMFPRLRAEWATQLAKIEKDSANIARVASNLAVNQLAWQTVLQHPSIGPVLAPYTIAHTAGLKIIARTMAKSTVEAMEAHQFRIALRELISSGQYKLIDRSAGMPNEFDRDRVVGWLDTNGVYLLPAIAQAAVKRLLGPSQLLISAQTLYGQMEQLGWLATTGKGQTTKLVSVDNKKIRVLHWLPDVLANNEDADGRDDEEGDETEAAILELGL